MNLSFEDELRGYMCSTKRECAVAKDDALAKTPEVNSWRLPEGFEASADPRYAYNKDNGYWLDIDSGTVSYYDEASHVYVPVDTVPDASQFAGVARLVVVESDNFAVGQIAEVDIEYGLDIGRDRPENGEVRHLRIPDIEVSRYHARIYFGIDVEKHNTVVKDPNHDAGSEDGEIEDTGASDLSEGECEEDNSVSRVTKEQPGQHLFVVDMGSTHGTFVNQQRLSESKSASKPQQLAHLDRISAGHTTLEVHIHEQWACSSCTNSGTNAISTAAMGPCENNSAAMAKPLDTQHKRFENLEAIKQRYASGRRHGVQKPSGYTDRARLRRGMHSNAHVVGPALQQQQIGGRDSAEMTKPPATIDADNKGYGMLQKMGWAPGTGLGAHSSGIVDPVSVEGNDDRTGLGAQPENPRSKAARITRERFYQD